MVIHLALHQWVWGSILATGCMFKWFPNPCSLSQLLQDLRFTPGFKIGMCLERSKHPFTQDVWGAAVLKVDVTI